MLRRRAYQQLLEWKRLKTKQGLLIMGARQVGKTTLVRQFAQEQYETLAEVNFIETPGAVETVSKASDAADLRLRLSVLAGAEIVPGKTLLFLDEIQACQDMLTWLKFLSGDQGLDVILSGSMLGVDLFNVRSIPVGFMQSMTMYPLDFLEFCEANGLPESGTRQMGECFAERTPVPDYLHDRLLDLWYKYLLVGGMPDAVQTFVDTSDIHAVRNVQRDIYTTYEYDITKYVDNPVERRHIKTIYEMIVNQLNAQNKRFKFTKLGPNARFAHMQTAFDWLGYAGIALPTLKVTEPRYPLAEHADNSSFKLYMNDVGLLTSLLMRDVDVQILNRRSSMNYGSIFENAAAQELLASGFELFYYNQGNIGEVDFLLQDALGEVSLCEIKSGKDYTRHNAMNNLLATRNYDFAHAYVFHDGNVRVEGKFEYLPIYMLSCVSNATAVRA